MLTDGHETDGMTWMELRGLACFLAWLLAIDSAPKPLDDTVVSDKQRWMQTGKEFLRAYPSWGTGEEQDAIHDLTEWLDAECE